MRPLFLFNSKCFNNPVIVLDYLLRLLKLMVMISVVFDVQ